jgi:hypothetical protein
MSSYDGHSPSLSYLILVPHGPCKGGPQLPASHACQGHTCGCAAPQVPPILPYSRVGGPPGCCCLCAAVSLRVAVELLLHETR